MTKKRLLLVIIIGVFFIISFSLILFPKRGSIKEEENVWWEIQSIDTVKYSRDLAREKQSDLFFDETIESQVKNIAMTGATHVALGTPYDQEFVSFLSRWVKAARKYNLNVWFRGNLSGWEGWFGYQPIDRQEHLRLIKDFILSNGELFEDGDIFSACTECENGGPGDPRRNGDVKGYREFLIEEYVVTNNAFRKIGKNVRSNFAPMNGDVAKLIMNKETTKALGGIVVIDHYVAQPEKLAADVAQISQQSGGKVFLGEFGAPIPDIHGQMTDVEQAEWVKETLTRLSRIPGLVGVNYWVNRGGATELWKNDGEPRMAVFTIESFFNPEILTGRVVNEIGKPVINARLILGSRSFVTQKDGRFIASYVLEEKGLTVLADGYQTTRIENLSDKKNVKVVLVKKNETIFFKVYKLFYKMVSK